MTVLFTDVVDSTSLGERLDPETFRKIMTIYFERMRHVLERHGGTLEKYIGDAIMAVFGVPVLHEDDAVRAVRAAAEMRSSLEGLNSSLSDRWGVHIDNRTGINTGEVLADERALHTPLGSDAANVAARLEQAAGAGEILIGDSTYRLVKDAVRVEPIAGGLRLKGKAAAVAAWRLIEVSPSGPGIARRLDSAMIARDAQHAPSDLGSPRIPDDRARICLVHSPAALSRGSHAEGPGPAGDRRRPTPVVG